MARGSLWSRTTPSPGNLEDPNTPPTGADSWWPTRGTSLRDRRLGPTSSLTVTRRCQQGTQCVLCYFQIRHKSLLGKLKGASQPLLVRLCLAAKVLGSCVSSLTPRAPAVATAHLPGMIRAGPHVAAFLPGHNRQSPPDRLSPWSLARSPRGRIQEKQTFPGQRRGAGAGSPKGSGKVAAQKANDWESAGDRARLLPQLRALGASAASCSQGRPPRSPPRPGMCCPARPHAPRGPNEAHPQARVLGTEPHPNVPQTSSRSF